MAHGSGLAIRSATRQRASAGTKASKERLAYVELERGPVNWKQKPTHNPLDWKLGMMSPHALYFLPGDIAKVEEEIIVREAKLKALGRLYTEQVQQGCNQSESSTLHNLNDEIGSLELTLEGLRQAIIRAQPLSPKYLGRYYTVTEKEDRGVRDFHKIKNERSINVHREKVGEVVCFGSKVELVALQSGRSKEVLVGSFISGGRPNELSYISPISQAILGAEVGEIREVEIAVPNSKKTYSVEYRVVKIS